MIVAAISVLQVGAFLVAVGGLVLILQYVGSRLSGTPIRRVRPEDPDFGPWVYHWVCVAMVAIGLALILIATVAGG